MYTFVLYTYIHTYIHIEVWVKWDLLLLQIYCSRKNMVEKFTEALNSSKFVSVV